jgi:prevent-host-death family protein
MPSITIKELHRATGEAVRRAGASNVPVIVTDHGKPVAVLANPKLLKARPPRSWTILPAFRKHILSKPSKGSIMEDLDAVRGDR